MVVLEVVDEHPPQVPLAEDVLTDAIAEQVPRCRPPRKRLAEVRCAPMCRRVLRVAIDSFAVPTGAHDHRPSAVGCQKNEE
jgi:hypothetical protein